MKRGVIFVVVAMTLLGAPARGDDDVTATPGQGTFNGAVEADSSEQNGGGGQSDGTRNAGVLPEPPTHPETSPACSAGGSEVCWGDQLTCPDGTPLQFTWDEAADGTRSNFRTTCPIDAAESSDPGLAYAQIARAFRQIPLPESVLVIQPPGGATLVNFDTNFLTVAAPFERTVTLLGHQVRFRIRPRSFAWHYGDGTDQTTSKPGAAYPALDVTHRYLEKGTVTPSVDTVWEADFQVDSGAWAPVDGTVTKAGAAQQLRVRSATPVLVG